MSNWFKVTIEQKYITSFEYDSFLNWKEIGRGGSELDWSTKIRMAKVISSAVNGLHNANIVHRDLHDRNILVHDGRLMITDFGLSKSLDNSTKSIDGGTYAFSDPQYLQNPFLYKRDKASDVYSLRVLFLELSSGVFPFKDISNGDPNLRPSIAEIRDKLNNIRMVIEVVRYITDNPNYIVEGRWFCQHWKCKHRLPCLNVEVCKNNCPHEPQCQTEMQCLSKWTCKHEPECNNRAGCMKRWICRHNPVCQSKWHCRKNWRCQHPIRCGDLWECKYRWTEEYEPHCQGEWQCHHVKKCQTRFECQKRPSREKWKCPHNPECYNKWKCQNKWQCQHKEKCDMSNPNLNECQNKCQHRCKTEKKCKEKSQALFQQLEH
ncbi:18160_t:CDS:2, partial [Cetraspora pellucida]